MLAFACKRVRTPMCKHASVCTCLHARWQARTHAPLRTPMQLEALMASSMGATIKYIECDSAVSIASGLRIHMRAHAHTHACIHACTR